MKPVVLNQLFEFSEIGTLFETHFEPRRMRQHIIPYFRAFFILERITGLASAPCKNTPDHARGHLYERAGVTQPVITARRLLYLKLRSGPDRWFGASPRAQIGRAIVRWGYDDRTRAKMAGYFIRQFIEIRATESHAALNDGTIPIDEKQRRHIGQTVIRG
jgi:hypothetical protein